MSDRSNTTSYRQKRCRHGWLNGDQCEVCKELAEKDAEIERLNKIIDEINDAAGRSAPT